MPPAAPPTPRPSSPAGWRSLKHSPPKNASSTGSWSSRTFSSTVRVAPLGDDAGFDAVVGTPPYVRQESLGDLQPYLAGAYAEVYHGVADLYVYVYEQSLRQLRRGGWMSYIVTNKWLRAGYGEPLRGYFAREGVIEEIVDFGRAPISQTPPGHFTPRP